MIAQLGSTTDPVALVPGSFAALFADAEDLRARARELLAERDGPVSRDTTSWTGDTADLADGRRANLADGLTGVAEVFAIAAIVLESHAVVLRWAQTRAALAIDLWAAGVARAADAGVPTLTLRAQQPTLLRQTPALPRADPGALLRRSAEHVLNLAWAEVQPSASAAAAILDEMSAGLPDGRFHLEEFVAGIGDWAAGLGQMVWKFNHIRALIDPGGVMADGREAGEAMWDSLYFAAEDPLRGVPALVDVETLQDNPGRWWGRLAPDGALALVPVAGALSKSALLARLLRRGADDLIRVADSPYPPGSPWADAAARERWVDDLLNGPDARPQTSLEDWADYQRSVVEPEVTLRGGGERINADGVALDPDTVVAVDTKYVGNPLGSPYNGTAPSYVVDGAMRGFDSELLRYRAVIEDAGNPVQRLRIVTSDPSAVPFLRARAQGILGDGVDLVVEYRP